MNTDVEELLRDGMERFTAVVRAASPGSGIPNGTVTFRDGTTALGTFQLDLEAGMERLFQRRNHGWLGRIKMLDQQLAILERGGEAVANYDDVSKFDSETYVSMFAGSGGKSFFQIPLESEELKHRRH